MRVILALVFLLLANAAQPQQLPIRPQAGIQTERVDTDRRNNRARDLRGTKEAPLFVEVIDANTAQRAEQDRIEKEEHATNERQLIFWTIILGIATVVLALVAILQFAMFRRQLRLMRDGAKDTKSVAHAAKISADAAKQSIELARADFFASHRPRIKVRRISRAIVEDHHIVEYTVANTGDTAATIVEISTLLWHEQAGERLEKYPAIPNYGAGIPLSLKIPSGTTITRRHEENVNLFAIVDQDSGFRSVGNKVPEDEPQPTTGSDLLFLGYVVYEDATGCRRRTAFCRRYIDRTKLFKPIADGDYEYED